MRLLPHTLRLRPRLDGSITLNTYQLLIDPQPDLLSTSFDAENNPITVCWFDQPTNHLDIKLLIEAQTHRANPFDFRLEPEHQSLPFTYPADTILRIPPAAFSTHSDDAVAELAQQAAHKAGNQLPDTLTQLAKLIQSTCPPEYREYGPPLSPAETLSRRTGSCRDLTLLYIHAARSLGLAARFVTGYEWAEDETLRNELHAWAEVYLPGAGWRGYDPSSGLAVANQHIPLAASANHEQAAAVSGSYVGPLGIDSLTHEVNVSRLD